MADNMLIDGLIKFCDEKSKNIKLKAEPQVFIEIKQVLEDLKEYKLKEFQCHLAQQEGITIGYNKAIDEFKNKICMHFADWQYSENDKCIKDIIESASESVEEIAEQMKAGGIDG